MARFGFWLCLLLPFLAWADDAPKVRSAVRTADYTIGGIARQVVEIETPKGYRLDAGSLPEKGQTEAIELRDVDWKSRDVGVKTHHRLVLDWQIFVAGDTTRIIPLKPLQLQFVREDKMLLVPIAAGKVIVSSLLPARLDKQLVQPYGDVPPPAMPLDGAWLVLGGGLSGMLVAMLYFAHHFGWIFQTRAPRHFRAAWRDIRRLARGQDETEAVRHAMLRLARAYDAVAGFAVSHERLDLLIAAYPGLGPLAGETAAFYRDVQQVFFAGQPALHDVSALAALSLRLSQAEAL